MDKSELHGQIKDLVLVELDKNTKIYVKKGKDVKAVLKKYKNRKQDGNRMYFDDYGDGSKPRVRVRRAD